MAWYRLPVDISGRRYGKWTVLGLSPLRDNGGGRLWLCRCVCGAEGAIRGTDLNRGTSKGCGCAKGPTKITHGHTRGGKTSSEYYSWSHMIQRCTNPSNKSYTNYGGRGIDVCGEWLDYNRFFADMGAKPSPKHTIERVDNDLGYSKDNCIWATNEVQVNNRRNTIFVELNGTRLLLTEACLKVGIPYSTVYGRMAKGLPDNQLFVKPINGL